MAATIPPDAVRPSPAIHRVRKKVGRVAYYLLVLVVVTITF